MHGTQPKDPYQVNPKKSEMLRDRLMPSSQRMVVERKTFNFDFIERMYKLWFPLIDDSARKTTKRPLQSKLIKIRDVERPLYTKQSADSSGVENVQL